MNQIEDDVDLIARISIVPSLLNIICQTTGMGFAAIARVTEKKWIACAVRDNISFGLAAGGELLLETTICNEIRQHQLPVVIDHVDEDRQFCNHHTPRMYGFQSYISVPIRRRDNRFFGTLCAIDPKPHRLNTPEIVGMFNLYADLISFHLQAIEQLSITEEKLALEQKTDQVRDQFIAILGHDLKNPLTSVLMSSELLKEGSLNTEDLEMVSVISRSAHRMMNLINNILDFARARLGNGIQVNRSFTEPLEDILRHVITENRIARPGQIIQANIRLTAPVYCDCNRIAELFSNLLGNALVYGDQNQPVTVNIQSDDKSFTLSVTNRGVQISDLTIKRLFEPFVRGAGAAGQQGLGLGLYIASEIARAHQGSLEVASNEKETCFTFTIPADNLQAERAVLEDHEDSV